MVSRKGLGKGRGKGYKNMLGCDSKTHSQSAKGIKQPQKINFIDKFAEVNKPKNKLSNLEIRKQIKKNTSILLKRGKGIERIPMKGLLELERAGKKFQEATKQIDNNLKEVQEEIRRRRVK